jgi:hypothetical protein
MADLSPVFFSLHVEDRLSTSRYIKLALYKDDMTITAMSYQPALLNDYLETY